MVGHGGSSAGSYLADPTQARSWGEGGGGGGGQKTPPLLGKKGQKRANFSHLHWAKVHNPQKKQKRPPLEKSWLRACYIPHPLPLCCDYPV